MKLQVLGEGTRVVSADCYYGRHARCGGTSPKERAESLEYIPCECCCHALPDWPHHHYGHCAQRS